MRVALANSTSAFVHIAALTGMAYWTLDAWQPQFQVAAGHAVTVQYSPASASSDADQTIQIESEPLPDTPLEIQEVKHEAQPVEVQRKPAAAHEVLKITPPEDIPKQPSPDETLPITKVVAEALPENSTENSEEPSEEKPTAQPPQNQIAAIAVEFQTADVAGVEKPDHLPEAIRNPLPAYPLDAIQAGIYNRQLFVRVRVNADGTVKFVVIDTTSGWPSMDQAAITTIQRYWRFEPARKNGSAMEFEIRFPVNFIPPRG